MKKKAICYNTLTNEELLQLYKTEKDLIAKEELIVRNIPLIKTLANKRMNFSNMSYEDLVQEGVIGLIYGIEKYDPSFGTKFSTYVFYWILEVIDRSIYNKGSIIRFPMHMVEKMNKINKLEKENSTKLTYTEEDICFKIGITLNEYHLIKYYLNYYKNISSLNKLVNDASVENDTPLLDFISENNSIYEETEVFGDTSTVEDEVLKKALKKEISSILKTLTPREEKILRLRYGLDDDTPRTLEEIGKIFNLTRERIRQIESKALRKLRHPRRANHLKEYI
jgi:RNA polymerase primary sigma factor